MCIYICIYIYIYIWTLLVTRACQRPALLCVYRISGLSSVVQDFRTPKSKPYASKAYTRKVQPLTL